MDDKPENRVENGTRHNEEEEGSVRRGCNKLYLKVIKTQLVKLMWKSGKETLT